MTHRRCPAAVLTISTGDRRPHQHRGGTSHASTRTTPELLAPLAAPAENPASDLSLRKEGVVKTIAVRLDDGVSELLGIVSQLEGTTIVD